VGVAVSFTAALFATSALSQDIQLQEVVVTAQKREQTLQDVPISVQVLGEQKLEAAQFKGVENIESVSPSVTFARHYHPAAHNVTIRGIGTQVSADGGYIQQSVIVSLDGIPASRAAGFWTELPDVQRIEVLRGPQGTLFGKNATSGVINIPTKGPSDQLGAQIEASAADDTGMGVSATMTGPIGPASSRLTLWHNRHEGWGKNYGSAPHDIGWLRSYGARGKLGFDLTPAAHVLLTAGGSQIRTNNQWFLAGANDSGAPGQHQSEILYPVVVGPHNDEVNINSDPFAQTKTAMASAQVNWKLTDQIELVSLTSYTDFRIKYRTDVDQNDLPFVPASTQLFALISWPDARTLQYGHEATQELRLQGTHERLTWTAGVFYSDYKEMFDTNQQQMTITTPVPTRRYRHVNYENVSSAVFADGEFKVTDAITAFGGVRYTHEHFDYDYLRDNSTPTTTILFGPWKGTASDTGWAARAGARWDVNHDVNVYAMWSKGYKGPALDLSDQLRTPNPLVPAEDADSYEVGMKSMLLDRRMRLNLALFRTEISNFQAFKIIPPIGTQLVTAGDVRSQGVELDLSYAVNRDLSIDLNAVYDDGTYQNTIFDCYPGQTAAQGCVIDRDGNGAAESQDLSGKPLALLPKWKVGLGCR
jgi:iron complex outermembrane receptor protein